MSVEIAVADGVAVAVSVGEDVGEDVGVTLGVLVAVAVPVGVVVAVGRAASLKLTGTAVWPPVEQSPAIVTDAGLLLVVSLA